MMFSYDYDADALYIEIADSPVVSTRQLDEGTMVDLDAYGDVVGIELPSGSGRTTSRSSNLCGEPPKSRNPIPSPDPYNS